MAGVPKVLKVTHYRVSRGRDAIYPHLFNEGTSDLPAGRLVVRQKMRDGTFTMYDCFNPTPLAPGQTTKLTLQVFNTRPLQLMEYMAEGDSTGSSSRFELDGKKTLKRHLFGWSLR
jgi:hypothetical protein